MMRALCTMSSPPFLLSDFHKFLPPYHQTFISLTLQSLDKLRDGM